MTSETTVPRPGEDSTWRRALSFSASAGFLRILAKNKRLDRISAIEPQFVRWRFQAT
jgi:hypothetical protein